jgi:hypothetical protein
MQLTPAKYLAISCTTINMIDTTHDQEGQKDNG